VSNLETLVANAARRALPLGDTEVVPRVCDLDALAASTTGKLEIETIEDGREGQIVDVILKSAILSIFREYVAVENLREVVEAFDGDRIVQAGEDVSAAEYVTLLSEVPALETSVAALIGTDRSPAMVASAVEFILEGLHLSKRLNKEASGSRAQYRGRS
jgi:magnesium chelatase subunit I